MFSSHVNLTELLSPSAWKNSLRNFPVPPSVSDYSYLTFSAPLFRKRAIIYAGVARPVLLVRGCGISNRRPILNVLYTWSIAFVLLIPAFFQCFVIVHVKWPVVWERCFIVYIIVKIIETFIVKTSTLVCSAWTIRDVILLNRVVFVHPQMGSNDTML